MSTSSDNVRVRRNEAESQFQAETGGELAVLEYEQDERGLTLTHTWVPPEAQGHGVGESLARAALDYARENGVAIIPGCTFVQAFIRKHPEYLDVVQPRFRRMVSGKE